MASNVPTLDFEIPERLADIAIADQKIASTEELDGNKKRWLVVGICLHSIISPILRKTIPPVMQTLYDTLVNSDKIDTQVHPNYLEKHPSSNKYFLNYQSINNNKTVTGPIRRNTAYDYRVRDPVELSKLFLAPNMTLYTDFDENCDSSALLRIIETVDAFDPQTGHMATQARETIRNPWAHCNFTEWDETKYEECFKIMKHFITSLRLSQDEDIDTRGRLELWEINGKDFISGSTLGLELVQTITQHLRKLETHILEIAQQTKKNFKDVNLEFVNIHANVTKALQSLETIETRLQDLEKRMGSTEAKLFEICQKKEIPKDHFYAPYRNESFVGRNQYLDKIKNILKRNKFNEQHKVTLCGLGGIGKTSIAIEYAWRNRATFPGGVFWLSGETNESFKNSIYRLAAETGTIGSEFQEMFAKTLSWLSDRQERSLIILDNVDEDNISGERVKFIHNRKMSDHLHHLIITSRRNSTQSEQFFACAKCIDVQPLSITDSTELIKLRTRTKDSTQDINIEKICKELGGLPLALDQASLVIKNTEYSFLEYLTEYQKEKLHLLDDEVVPYSETTEDARRLSVNSTWHINLKQIEQQSLMLCSKNEIKILMEMISCLAGNDIPVEIFNEGYPPVEYENLKVTLQDKTLVKRIIKVLTNFSLFKKSGDSLTSKKSSDLLTVHKLVQTVIRNSIDDDGVRRTKIIQCASRMIQKAATTARELLDSKLISRLQDQRNALKESTCTWTIDHRTGRDLDQLSQCLNKYGNDIWEVMEVKERRRLDDHRRYLEEFGTPEELKAWDELKKLKKAKEEEYRRWDEDDEPLSNKLCTFTITQEDYIQQHWYHCHTCKMVGNNGVCTVCAKVCHKDHDLKYADFTSFYCDCGSKEDGTCKALVKRTVQSAINSTEQVPIPSPFSMETNLPSSLRRRLSSPSQSEKKLDTAAEQSSKARELICRQIENTGFARARDSQNPEELKKEQEALEEERLAVEKEQNETRTYSDDAVTKSPVDVPGHQMAEAPVSPMVMAPVKEGEAVIEEIQQERLAVEKEQNETRTYADDAVTTSPVDVPGHQMAEAPVSPIILAPVKEGEAVIEEIQQARTANWKWLCIII